MIIVCWDLKREFSWNDTSIKMALTIVKVIKRRLVLDLITITFELKQIISAKIIVKFQQVITIKYLISDHNFYFKNDDDIKVGETDKSIPSKLISTLK